ncbi:MAG: phytoene/squalene synthase family protein [Candidatus Nanopelagicales bacterium]
MSARELTAAGITDPALRESYLRCRKLNAQHGKTYFLATRLLPPGKRPFVHALYGFARYADEIVDDLASTLSPEEKAAALTNWGNQVLADLKVGSSADPIAAALVDTVTRWQIPIAHIEAFLKSMAMDLTVTQYATYSDLYEYVYGSAAVIGLQMVPILEPISDAAYEPAKDLGVAFQLANFIRDVNEDLDRGRIYLPIEDLTNFGVSVEELKQRKVTPKIRELLKFEIARVRELEQRAIPGIQLLSPASRPCIDAARILYCGITKAVEDIDYQIFDKRAKVTLAKRIQVAGNAWREARKYF